MLKDSVYSVVGKKCPQCHQSDVFKSNAVFNLKTFDKMNESCSCCGMKYEKEPGYFYGAMYVSYALVVGWFVLTFIIDSFIVKSQTWQYLTFFVSTIIVMMPLTFRTSRLIWLNLFVKYDPSKTIYHHSIKQ